MLVRVIDARFTTNTFRTKSRGILQTCADLGLWYIGADCTGSAANGAGARQALDLQPLPQLKDCKNIKINAVLTPEQALLS